METVRLVPVNRLKHNVGKVQQKRHTFGECVARCTVQPWAMWRRGGFRKNPLSYIISGCVCGW